MNVFKKKIIFLVLIFSVSAGCFSTCDAFSWNFLWSSRKSSVVKKRKKTATIFMVGLCAAVICVLISFLKKKGGDQNPTGFQDLGSVCKEGDFEKVKKIFKNEENRRIASSRNSVIIDEDADYWIKEEEIGSNRSPLHYAAESGNLEFVKFLIGKLKNKKRGLDRTKLSIFDCACESGNDEIFKFLVNQELQMNIDYKKERYLKNPICVASVYGKNSLVRWLVEEKGFDVNQKDLLSFSVLHKASEKGYLDIVKYLISKGANTKAKEIKSFKYAYALPVHLACEKGHLDVVVYFVEKCGISIDEIDMYGRSLIFYACKSDNVNLIKWLALRSKSLINKKALDLKYEKTETRIFSGVSFIREEIEKELSLTPLDIARQKGNQKVIEELLAHLDKSSQKKGKLILGQREKNKKIDLKELHDARIKRKQKVGGLNT